MSISSEVTRIQTAKAAIKAKIEELTGNNVDSSALLGSYPTLIEGVYEAGQAAGGGGGGTPAHETAYIVTGFSNSSYNGEYWATGDSKTFGEYDCPIYTNGTAYLYAIGYNDPPYGGSVYGWMFSTNTTATSTSDSAVVAYQESASMGMPGSASPDTAVYYDKAGSAWSVSVAAYIAPQHSSYRPNIYFLRTSSSEYETETRGTFTKYPAASNTTTGPDRRWMAEVTVEEALVQTTYYYWITLMSVGGTVCWAIVTGTASAPYGAGDMSIQQSNGVYYDYYGRLIAYAPYTAASLDPWEATWTDTRSHSPGYTYSCQLSLTQFSSGGGGATTYSYSLTGSSVPSGFSSSAKVVIYCGTRYYGGGSYNGPTTTLSWNVALNSSQQSVSAPSGSYSWAATFESAPSGYKVNGSSYTAGSEITGTGTATAGGTVELEFAISEIINNVSNTQYTFTGFSNNSYNGTYTETNQSRVNGYKVFQNGNGMYLFYCVYQMTQWDVMSGWVVAPTVNASGYYNSYCQFTGTYDSVNDVYEPTGSWSGTDYASSYSSTSGTCAAGGGGSVTPVITIVQQSVSVSGTAGTAITSIDLSGSSYTTISPSGTTRTFSASGLPSGLSLSSAGVLSGTPSAASSASVTVTVSASGATSKTLTLVFSIAASGSGGGSYDFTLTGTNDSAYDGGYTYDSASGKYYHQDGLTYMERVLYNGSYDWNIYRNGNTSGDYMLQLETSGSELSAIEGQKTWTIVANGSPYQTSVTITLAGGSGGQQSSGSGGYTVSDCSASSANGAYAAYDTSGYGGTQTYSNGSYYMFKVFSADTGDVNWVLGTSISTQCDYAPDDYICYAPNADTPPTSGWTGCSVSGGGSGGGDTLAVSGFIYYTTANGTYTLTDPTATGDSRVWSNGTYKIAKISGGPWWGIFSSSASPGIEPGGGEIAYCTLNTDDPTYYDGDGSPYYANGTTLPWAAWTPESGSVSVSQ